MKELLHIVFLLIFMFVIYKYFFKNYVHETISQTLNNRVGVFKSFPKDVFLVIHKMKTFRHYNSSLFDMSLEILYEYYSKENKNEYYPTRALTMFEELSFAMSVEESFRYQKLLNRLSCLLNIDSKPVLPANHINNNYFE